MFVSSSHITIFPSLPCSYCGRSATIASVLPATHEQAQQVPTLRDSFILKPLCQTCMDKMVGPPAYGVCSLRQHMQE